MCSKVRSAFLLVSLHHDAFAVFITAHSARQKGRGQHVAINEGWVTGTLTNLSCDWLRRFMKFFSVTGSTVQVYSDS